MASISADQMQDIAWAKDRVATLAGIGLICLTLTPVLGVLVPGTPIFALASEVVGYGALLSAFVLRAVFSGMTPWKLGVVVATLVLAIAFVLANLDLTATGIKSLLLTVVSPLFFLVIGKRALPGALLSMRMYVIISAATLISSRSDELMSRTLSRDSIFTILGENRLQGFLVSPNTNGALLATYVVAEIVLLSCSATLTSRLTKMAVLSLAVLQLLQTGSLTAISAAIAGLACFFVRAWWFRRALLLGAVAYAFYPAAAIFIDLLSAGTRPLPFDSEFATGRGQIWYRVSELIRSHPWGSSAAIALPGESGNGLVTYGGGHAHNLVLQIWLVGGWFAVLGALIVAFVLVYKAWSSVLPLTASVVFFVLCFAEVPLFLLPGSLNFLVVSAWVSLSTLGRRRFTVA